MDVCFDVCVFRIATITVDVEQGLVKARKGQPPMKGILKWTMMFPRRWIYKLLLARGFFSAKQYCLLGQSIEMHHYIFPIEIHKIILVLHALMLATWSQ